MAIGHMRTTLGASLLALGFVVIGSALQTAAAAVILTNDRNDIELGFKVDWADLGPELTGTGASFDLNGVTVSGAPGFTVFNQGSVWNGNFASGDAVLGLWDAATLSPHDGIFSFAFATPVASVGTQVQALDFGAFTGTISAYSSTNVLLGSFSFNGNSNGNGDNSAIFAGLVSDGLGIARLEISGLAAGAGINFLSVGRNRPDPKPAVPEPGTILLFMLGLACLALARQQRFAFGRK